MVTKIENYVPSIRNGVYRLVVEQWPDEIHINKTAKCSLTPKRKCDYYENSKITNRHRSN